MGRSHDAGREARRPIEKVENETRRPTSKPAATSTRSPPQIGEGSLANSSSTTLRSIVERLRPTEAAGLESEKEHPELRRTPFGVVRVASGASDAKEKDEAKRRRDVSDKTLLNDETSRHGKAGVWPCDARGLPPVRQRIRGGRAELRGDGTVVVRHRESTFALFIASDGQRATLYNIKGPDRSVKVSDHVLIHQLPLFGQTLYTMADAWLSRYLASVSVASFCTRTPSVVCYVRANAPLADYEVHLPAVDQGRHAKRTGDMSVHVIRRRHALTLSSFIGDNNDPSQSRAWSWRLTRLLIEKKSGGWQVTADDLNQQLALPELHAVEHALSISNAVDAVSAAIGTAHDRKL